MFRFVGCATRQSQLAATFFGDFQLQRDVFRTENTIKSQFLTLILANVRLCYAFVRAILPDSN